MKVEQLMTKAPCVCTSSSTLNDAARVLWETDCGIVPIVERSDGVERVVGVLTDRDICMAAYTTGQKLEEIAVERVMSKELRTCSPSTSIETAEKTMRASQIRRLPVVDDGGGILGILSLGDIAREAGRGRGRKAPGVTVSKVGSTLGAIVQPRSAE